MVNADEESHTDWKENTWSLSESGKVLISLNKTVVEDIKRKINDTLEEYDDVKAKAIKKTQDADLKAIDKKSKALIEGNQKVNEELIKDIK